MDCDNDPTEVKFLQPVVLDLTLLGYSSSA